MSGTEIVICQSCRGMGQVYRRGKCTECKGAGRLVKVTTEVLKPFPIKKEVPAWEK